MKGESTYNKYKRQNIAMKAILSADAQNFMLEDNDWKDKAAYLRKCILMYRHNKLKESIEL